MAKNSSLRVIDIGAIGSANVQVIGGASSVAGSHVLATTTSLGAEHRVAGLTAGQVLRATGATTAAFQVLADSDLPATIVRTSRTITAGDGLTGGGDLSANRTLAVGAGLGITVNADDVALTTPGSLTATSTNSSTGSHTHAIDSTIARSAITISAGDGLTGGGDLSANRTLTVGAGLGITVNADDVALTTPGSLTATSTNSSTGSHTHAIDSTIARSVITITAGAGLTGGGDLSANRTLTVGAGTLITVNADDVALSNGSAQYQIPVTGATTFTPAWTLLSTLAGNGLTFASGALSVGAGNGITVNADDVALTTPGTLTVSSTNSASGSHTHAVTSSSAPTGAVLLAANASGHLRLVKLGIAMDPTYALDVTGSARVSDDLYVTDALDVDGAADIYGGLTAARSRFQVLSHTGTDHAHVVINPAVGWTVDEQFDLDVGGSALVRGYIVGKHALQIAGAKLICHFDGPDPYTTNFTGDPTGHMGQVGTVTGGGIYRPGKFGKAVQLAGATTNLLLNPSWEGTVTGTDTNGSPTLSVSDSYAVFGTKSRHVVGNGDAGGEGLIVTTETAANTAYTFSVYLRGTGSVALRTYDNVAGHQIGSTITLSSTWTRYSITKTFGAGSTTRRVYVLQSGAAGDWFTDGWQLEQKTYATPYCDGSLGAGHAWTGTAHASTSSRTGATLTYPTAGMFDVFTGTISLWVRHEADHGGGLGLFAAGANGQFDAYATADSVVFRMAATGASANVTVSMAIWHHYCFVWSSADNLHHIYLDGVLVGSRAYDAGATIGSELYCGTIAAGSAYSVNGLVDDFFLLDRALSAAEVRAIYESNAPVFAETSTWQWRAGRNLFFADAEGIWMYDASGNAMLGAYAGDGVGGGTKSWGSLTLSPGDVLIGKSTSYVLWDASAAKLEISGKVTATEGAIGGWTLGATALTAGSGANTVGIDSGGTNPAFYAGSATPASAPFRVTQAGVVTMTSGSIAGSIVIGVSGKITSSEAASTNRIDITQANIDFYAYSNTGLHKLRWLDGTDVCGALGPFYAPVGANNLDLHFTGKNWSFWGNDSTTTNFGSGSKVIHIHNATTVPTGNATNGGILYVESGALKYRGSSGTVTTLGAA